MSLADGGMGDAEGTPYLETISKTLQEIAGLLKPDDDCPNTTKAQMAGLAFSFSDMLTEIQDNEDLNLMQKAQKIRELAARAKALGTQYSAEQAQIDQSYVGKKQRLKNSIWKTSDGD